MRLSPFGTAAALFVLAACTSSQPGFEPPGTVPVHPAPEAPTGPPEPGSAKQLGAELLPFFAIPGWYTADVAAALEAFRKSCASVQRRSDPSGLTISDDWVAPCAEAKGAVDARGFFERNFTPVRVGAGEAFVTGYYEPEIAGCRTKRPGCEVPIYAKPADLVRVEQPDPENPGQTRPMTGRIGEDGRFTLYWDRAAIDAGALAGRGLEIAYAEDYIELFFLHIQGSGRLRLPDGGIMRIGYAGQNGREYVGIGRRLRDMDALAPGEASMQGIIRWLRANPERGRALMHENKSYIFFQELTGEGPLGAMGAPVTPEVSLAADPRFVPLGAPVLLTTSYIGEDGATHPFERLMVAQDTGGAIKGANRFDLFWGAGERARAIAGGLSSPGAAVILIPNAAAQRLRRDGLFASRDYPAAAPTAMLASAGED